MCATCHPQADVERETEGITETEERQRIGLLRSRWARRRFGNAWKEVPADVVDEEWRQDCGASDDDKWGD